MSLIDKYKKFYGWAVTFKGVVKKEKDTWVSMPFFKRLNMWRHGFWSVTQFRYDFEKYKMTDYVSDYADNLRWIKLDNANYEWFYFDNKVLFPTVVKHRFKVPENLTLILDKKMLPISEHHGIKNISDLLAYVKTTGAVIIKPVDGLCGIGVHALEAKDGDILLDYKKIDPAELEKKILDMHNCIICERVVNQNEYAKSLYPDTLNTIRILTLKDPDNNEVFIAGAVQRIGTSYSYPVDNFHRGGIAAKIDIETGMLGPAAAIFPVSSNTLKWHEIHPDTGKKIKGVIVPEWETLKKQVLALADDMSFCRIIGWDVAITENGYMLIEGNNGADPKIHQIHEPLLINPRVRRFCEYYKIV